MTPSVAIRKTAMLKDDLCTMDRLPLRTPFSIYSMALASGLNCNDIVK